MQVEFNRRFGSACMSVRQAVASGEIGKPSLMQSISRHSAPRMGSADRACWNQQLYLARPGVGYFICPYITDI
jgi:predicted dehydrogenase